MAKPITRQHPQTTDHSSVGICCLCSPFVAIGRLIRNALEYIADFFKSLCSSTRTLTPERITPTPVPAPNQDESSNTRCPSRDLIRFYKGHCPTDRNISFFFLLDEAGNDWLETNHYWVQWAFPTIEPSGANPTAPILDEETITQFQQDPELQAKLLQIFKRTLRFFGLTLQEDTGAIVEGADFVELSVRWNESVNHNHLRITRILKCLKLLQAPSSARSWSETLFLCLKGIHKISPANFDYWQKVHPHLK